MTAQQLQLFNLEQKSLTWLLYFFAYGVVGWLWESGYVSVKKHHWTNSGFLIGPIIPIYGFSMMAVLAAIEPFENNILILYFAGAILITIIEYITSWGMEKLFHARWWDYSDIPLNLNGRVAIPVSLFWGIGVVFIVKCIHPFIAQIVSHLTLTYGNFVAIAMLALMTFDLGFTVANVAAFGASTKRIGEAIETKKAELHNRFEASTDKLQQELSWLEDYRNHPHEREQLPRLTYVQRRLLKSFPSLKLNQTQTSPKDIVKLSDLIRRRKSKK